MRNVSCDTCGKLFKGDYTDQELEAADEVICPDCEMNRAENAWERHCEDFHDGGCTRFNSLEEQMAAARKLK
jgi:DNA-directed RNA polymerase subunit RPC12/RpoP